MLHNCLKLLGKLIEYNFGFPCILLMLKLNPIFADLIIMQQCRLWRMYHESCVMKKQKKLRSPSISYHGEMCVCSKVYIEEIEVF